jgi:hypothetical protein
MITAIFGDHMNLTTTSSRALPICFVHNATCLLDQYQKNYTSSKQDNQQTISHLESLLLHPDKNSQMLLRNYLKCFAFLLSWFLELLS